MGEEVQEVEPNACKACWSGFSRFMYNTDDHTVMGRDGASWAKILLFYGVYYSCLAGFFAVCLHIMLMTLPADKPTVIGRTNKPYVAISEQRLYTMDFTDKEPVSSYVQGATALKAKYMNITANETSTPKIFGWEDKYLGDCKDVSQGCFYMALNRIIGWAPKLGEDENLAFDCAWDIGKSGKGNLSPPFSIAMTPKLGEVLYEDYYPWVSKEKNGLQPVAALKVVMDVDAAKKVADDKLETYIKCGAYARTSNGTKTLIEDARSALFTIKYSNQ